MTNIYGSSGIFIIVQTVVEEKNESAVGDHKRQQEVGRSHCPTRNQKVSDFERGLYSGESYSLENMSGVHYSSNHVPATPSSRKSKVEGEFVSQ